MRRESRKVLVASSVIGIIAATLSATAAEDAPAKPSTDEIRRIEGKVRMPRHASAKKHYARYYFAVWKSERRIVKAIYVEKAFISPSEVPAGGIAIVTSESEIPVPQDAECGVVFVEYSPGAKSLVDASCSAGNF